jgi:septal ring factor EnvC (AmiA/AmiB activator)
MPLRHRSLSLALSALAVAVLSPAESEAARAVKLRSLLKSEAAALRLLSSLNGKLLQTTLELEDLRLHQRQLDYQVDEARRRIEALGQRVTERREKIGLRVRSLYKLSRGGFLRLLLDRADGRGMVQRLAALKLILRRDVRERRLYRRELTQLASEQKQLAARQERHRKLEQRARDKLLSLQTARREQRRALLRVERNRRRQDTAGRTEGKLVLRARRLMREIKTLRYRVNKGAGFVTRRGHLPRPVVGSVAGTFGQLVTRSKARGTRGRRVELLRQGLTFRPTRRARVKAVAEGVVRVAGTFPGYGELVLVEHDDGFYSLYGFLSRVLVNDGDPVKRGAVLGRAGRDPLSDRPALYFELRHRERPLDPANWLSGAKQR